MSVFWRKEEKEKFFRLGEFVIPPSFETRHFLIVGRTGTGKTNLIYQVLRCLRERGDRVVVYDFKGDYLGRFYQEGDVIFCPVVQGGARWNPFTEIQFDFDADRVAGALIVPPEKGEENQRFWREAAKQVLASILWCSKAIGAGVRELKQFLAANSGDLVALLESWRLQGIRKAEVALGYAEGHAQGSKIWLDTLSTLRQSAWAFQYLDDEADFDLGEWIRRGRGWLFLLNYARFEEAMRFWNTMAINLLVDHILDLPDDEDRRIWFVLDEFPSLHPLPKVLRGLAIGRSKGLCFVMAAQDFSQLAKRYDVEARTIVNNCNTLVAFAVDDTYTMHELAKLFGQQEVEEARESLSMGPEDYRDGLTFARHTTVKPVVLPSEFIELKRGEAFMKTPVGAARVRFPYVPPPPVCNEFKVKEGLRQ